MRKVRYSVAMSLDGFLADPDGEVDWLPEELDFDWTAFMGRFDTAVMGRTTFEFMMDHGGVDPASPLRHYVCSRTLDPAQHPQVTVVDDAVGAVSRLREGEGKEVWLMGGGGLLSDLLDARLVDAVELVVVPILLGGGVPFIDRLAGRTGLTLTECRELGHGTVMLVYEVPPR
jgi:dihydrofolate reductase